MSLEVSLMSRLRLEPLYAALTGFLRDRHDDASDADLWLAVLVQHALTEGHVCLEKSRIAERLQRLFEGSGESPPSADELTGRFVDSPLIVEARLARELPAPMVRDGERLYFHRYWRNEQRIAQRLTALVKRPDEQPIDLFAVDRLFGENADDVDYQKLAAVLALRHRLLMVSGGPGTGKTWAVSRVLALLLQRNPALRIALAAPTGKAAARLSEAIDASRADLGPDAELQARIPQKALTLHRLLGIHPMSHRPRHHAENPLPLDLLVLDEASMIDQSLMTQVCDALPPQARLILLGDKDQLASVEAGSVFADLCGGLSRSEVSAEQQQWLREKLSWKLPLHQDGYRLADQVVVLQKSRRFHRDSGIGKLARQINAGDAEGCIETLLRAVPDDGLSWRQQGMIDYGSFAEGIYREMMEADSVKEAFDLFEKLQLLAAVWKGPLGVDQINQDIERTLKQQAGLRPELEHYHGKPLMMASNVYQYGIHNGDIGIVWRDDQSGELRLQVQTAEGMRSLALSQLPHHHSAYAMTIHKSQGSEFDRVVIVLPQADSPLMTRELLYTAVTRARNTVEIHGSEAALRAAVDRRTERMSGLRDRLTSRQPR